MEQPSPTPIPAGTIFGGYQIVKVRGSGTFGCVYEALRLPLQRRVALKLLDPRLSQHPEALARFEREAVTTAALEHPHIVDVFDVGVVGEQHYLAMECLDGETLADRIAREAPLPLVEVVDVFVPLLSAIALVHDRGCVHRDLKPGNIFLAVRHGAVEPVLLDFGIVKAAQGVGDTRLTRKGALLGSPAYMSPEQARSLPIDARSDQFSLGAILWECLTGKRLFTGTSIWQILAAVQKAEVSSLHEARPDLPLAAVDAVMRALAQDPSRRFNSARELGAALLAYASPSVRARWTPEFGGATSPGTPDTIADLDDDAPPRSMPVVTFDGVVEEASLPPDAQTLPLPNSPPLDAVRPTVRTPPPASLRDGEDGAATTPLDTQRNMNAVWVLAIVASLLVIAAVLVAAFHR